MTNYTGLCDAWFTWYSPSAAHQICLCSLEHDLGIHALRPIWLWLIIEVFATRAKFLHSSASCIKINCVNLTSKECFWLLLQRYGPIQIHQALVPELDDVTRSSVRYSSRTHGEARHNMLAHKLPWYYQQQYYFTRLERPHKAPTKTIHVRRTRHTEHCWRSRDELISDVLLWTPTYGRAKAGRPARTYIQQLCEDTGGSPEDLPEAMNDREKWRERVRHIRASSTTWWWWWWWWMAPIYAPLALIEILQICLLICSRILI